MIVVSLLIIVIIVIEMRRYRLNSAKGFLNDIHLRRIIRSHNRDKMEVEIANIELHEILGEGAFGMVRRGTLKPLHLEIAVKMLKGMISLHW